MSSTENALEIRGADVFTCRMSYPSHNQQCRSTEEVSLSLSKDRGICGVKAMTNMSLSI